MLRQTTRIVLIQSTKDSQHPTQSSFQIDIPKGERKYTDRHTISTTNGYKGWGVIGELQTCCSIFKTPTLDLHFPLLLCLETTRRMQSPLKYSSIEQPPYTVLTPATGGTGELGTIRHGTVSVRSGLSLTLLIITSYSDVERRCDTPHQTF